MAETEFTVILSLVGCQHRAHACHLMQEDPDWYLRMSLEYAPDNAYNPEAVKVLYKGLHVGYVSNNSLTNVREAMLKGTPKAWEVVESKFHGSTLQWVEMEVAF